MYEPEEKPTVDEWRTFVVAAKHDTWVGAATELGLANKYVVERVLKRLAKKLGVDRLVVDQGHALRLDERYAALATEAEAALLQLQALGSHATGERLFTVRFDAYSAHVEQFAAEVLGDFERQEFDLGDDMRGRLSIDLVPSFGRSRRAAGAGMLLGLNERLTDLVIAPLDDGEELDPETEAMRADEQPRLGADPRPRRCLRAHDWSLLAAGRPERLAEVQSIEGDRMPVADLARSLTGGARLLTSPLGHRSRRLLDAESTSDLRFDVVATGDEPAALVATAMHSDRIALVASDCWLPSQWDRSAWPAVVGATGEVLGGSYGVFWREQSQPRALVSILRGLACALADRAQSTFA